MPSVLGVDEVHVMLQLSPFSQNKIKITLVLGQWHHKHYMKFYKKDNVVFKELRIQKKSGKTDKRTDRRMS